MIKIPTIYYNQSKKIYILCKIEDHEIFNQEKFLKSKHVEYIINIQSFYKNWTIKKRYSQFVELNNILSNKISCLPEFPEKRIFSLSEDVILERKIKFGKYLNYIFKNINICVYPEILEFIQMEKDLLNLFMINNSFIENTSNSSIKFITTLRAKSNEEKIIKRRSYGGINFEENYFNSYLDIKYKLSDIKEKMNKSANMMVIEEFLRNLQYKSENKIDIIQTFELFLKSKKNWPNFKLEELSKLFYGDLEADNIISITSNKESKRNSKENIEKIELPLKGLIYHIGRRVENILGAEACLVFLGKLINFEFNPECEAYIYMLKITKIDQLNSMKLVDHINTGKQNIILVCFSVLKAILTEDKCYLIKLKRFIKDDKIINNYLSWTQVNSV